MSMRYNNNPRNNKAYIDFHRRQLELAKLTEADAIKGKIASNLDTWETGLPDSLKRAKPDEVPKSAIDKFSGFNINPPYEKQLVITSNHVASSTFVAYSVIYSLIKAGKATPSQIKTTSLLDGYNNINGMFQSRKWKDNFFDDNARVLLIEGSSKSLTSLAPRGEDQFWKELIEFVRGEQRLVIITYATDDEEYGKGLFVPSFTNDSTINRSLIKKSIFVNLSKQEEDLIRNEQTKIN